MPSQDFEQRFFDLSIDMLCVLDFSGYFKLLNPAWESTLGLTREDTWSRMLEGAAKIVLNQLFEQLGREAGGGAAVPAEQGWWAKLLAFLGVKR